MAGLLVDQQTCVSSVCVGYFPNQSPPSLTKKRNAVISRHWHSIIERYINTSSISFREEKKIHKKLACFVYNRVQVFCRYNTLKQKRKPTYHIHNLILMVVEGMHNVGLTNVASKLTLKRYLFQMFFKLLYHVDLIIFKQDVFSIFFLLFVSFFLSSKEQWFNDRILMVFFSSIYSRIEMLLSFIFIFIIVN